MSMDNGIFTSNETVWLTRVRGGDARGNGLFRTLAVSGTWGGATVSIVVENQGDTIDLVADLVLSADGIVNFQLAAERIGVKCAGGTSHNLKWSVF